MQKLLTVISLIGIAFVFVSCAAPATFIKTHEPSWATVELRTDVTYDRAWTMILDRLIRDFDIEIAQKENGYIRTGWLYTWTGKITEYYRVRLTVKFPEDRKSVEIKSEAYYRDYIGYDSRLLETYKTDIMGSVGRTTR